jgi:hypothetical protein
MVPSHSTQELTFIKSHPIREIFLKILENNTITAKETGTKQTHLNVSLISAALKDLELREEKKLAEKVEQMNAQIESNILHKELNSLKITQEVPPPSEYSVTDKLYNLRLKQKLSPVDNSDTPSSTDITRKLLMTTTQVNLVEIAALADISATSYALTTIIEEECHPKLCCYAVDDMYSTDFSLELESFCALYINKMCTVVCIDNGSDLTVMQYTLFVNIFPYTHKRILEPSNLKSITSFYANPISVHGQYTCLVSFSEFSPKVAISITVIRDISGVPTMLLGNDSLRTSWAVLAFAGDKNDSQPELIIRNSVEQNVNVYYVPPRELFMCCANVNMEPFATKTVELVLNCAAPVLRNQEIIISSPEWGEIQIFPSKTDICFDPSQDRYLATVLVANLTSKPLSQTVVAIVRDFTHSREFEC